MAALKNNNHEQFCKAVVSGRYPDPTAAYRAVYPKASPVTARVNACNLMKRPEIQGRIDERTDYRERVDQRIGEKVVEKTAERISEKLVASREWIIDRLVETANRAMKADELNGATACRALELLGKEVGMFVDRTESLNTSYAISDQPMTQEEWAAKFATPVPTDTAVVKQIANVVHSKKLN
jgi:phage terminase small subunit